MTMCACNNQLQPHERTTCCPLPLIGVHPGRNHEFRTTCLLCGEPGWLHVALITSHETVTIAAREEPKP